MQVPHNIRENCYCYCPFGQPKTDLKKKIKNQQFNLLIFFFTHKLVYHLPTPTNNFRILTLFSKKLPIRVSMLNICIKCGYVQRELVCLLLPTSSSVNNNTWFYLHFTVM